MSDVDLEIFCRLDESTKSLMEFFEKRFAPCDVRSYEWNNYFMLFLGECCASVLVIESTVRIESGLLVIVVDLMEPDSLERVDGFVGLVRGRCEDLRDE